MVAQCLAAPVIAGAVARLHWRRERGSSAGRVRRDPRGATAAPLGRRLLLAGLQAAPVAVGAEGAEVQDALAVADLPGTVEPDPRRVLTRPAVDRAAAVVGPDIVLAGASLDDRRPVAGIDPVVARAAVEEVLLARVVVR